MENTSTMCETQGEDIVVMSLDVKKLFNNLDIKASAKEVHDEVL